MATLFACAPQEEYFLISWEHDSRANVTIEGGTPFEGGVLVHRSEQIIIRFSPTTSYGVFATLNGTRINSGHRTRITQDSTLLFTFNLISIGPAP